MAFEDVPRTLVYKDFENIKNILGSESQETLEREYYERLILQPFIENSDNPPKWIRTVFNNARYIYYLVYTEEDDDPSLCFKCFLAKAAEGVEDADLKSHIVTATMALVYSWLNRKLHENRIFVPELKKEIFKDFIESKEENVKKLCKKINLYFSKEEKEVTSEIIKVFDDLNMEKSDLPTNIDNLYGDMLGIEEAASNAPILDVARGIDYLMDCYDPEYGTNEERYFFLNKILNRFENEKSPIIDSDTIDKAIVKINREIQRLELSSEPKPFSSDLSFDFSINTPIEENSEIDSYKKSNYGWISEEKKAPIIIETLMEYMKGKITPKDIMMPIRAAIDAGAIRKPTPKEFNKAFGANRIKSKTSINYYCRLDLKPYIGENYNNMVEAFKQIKAE